MKMFNTTPRLHYFLTSQKSKMLISVQCSNSGNRLFLFVEDFLLHRRKKILQLASVALGCQANLSPHTLMMKMTTTRKKKMQQVPLALQAGVWFCVLVFFFM